MTIPGTEPIANGTEFCPRHHKAMLGKSEAKSLAKRSAKMHGTNFQAYKCPSCHKWHVGNLRRFK